MPTAIPNIAFRICRTLDCKRVLATCMMYEQENMIYNVKRGWTFPETPLPRPYEIRETAGRGRGVYATRDIQYGEVILRELPMILMPQIQPSPANDPSAGLERFLLQMLYWLEPEDRKMYLSLHNCKPYKQCGILSGIFHTNALGIEFPEAKFFCSFYTAVCRDISFLNHSCSPNAAQSQDYKTLIFQISAERFIRAGEEITISYISLLDPHAERRRDLMQKYSFLCTCRACTVDPSASDARRLLIRTAMATYDDDSRAWRSSPKKNLVRVSRRQIEHFRNVLRALDEEGLEHGRAEFTQKLALLYGGLRDTENFKIYGTMAREVLKATGDQDGMIKQWEEWLEDPMSVARV